MTTKRPQLGVSMLASDIPIVDGNGLPTLDFQRVLDRVVAMNANDETFMLEVHQETKDGEIDDLRLQVEVLTAGVNQAIDLANQAASNAEDAAVEAVAISNEAALAANQAASNTEDTLTELIAAGNEATAALNQSASETDDILTDLINTTNIAAAAANQAASNAEDIESNALLAISNVEQLLPRGDLANLDQADRTDIVNRALGAKGLGSEPDTLWYTAGGTPSKKTADYDDIVFRTKDFFVEEGANIDINWSYTLDAVLNMFEWFMWQELVVIKNSAGTTLETIISKNEFMPATTGTNGVPGGYKPSLNLGPTHNDRNNFIVPALGFPGTWPFDGLVYIECTLAPHSGLSSPGDECFSGSTFDAGATTIKNGFGVVNMTISGEPTNDGPFEITS